MGVMDRYNEKKKKKDEESTGGKSSSGGVAERYERNQYYQTLDTDSVDEKYINSFISDTNTFFKGVNEKSISYDAGKSTLGDLSTRYDTIQGWLYKNKSNINKESYTKLSSTFDGLKSNFDDLKDFYSRWDTADAYNAAVKKAEEDAAKWAELTGGYDPTKNQAEGKIGWEEYVALQDRLAQQTADREEAKKKEGYSLEQFWDDLGRWMGPGVNPDTSLPFHTDTQLIAQGYRDEEAAKRVPDERWTDEQRYTYGYLWKDSRQKAAEYAYAINNMLNIQQEQEQIQQIVEWSTDNFGSGAVSTAGAILAAPSGLADFLGDVMQSGTLGYIPEADGTITPFEYSQAVTSGIGQHLNTEIGTLNDDIPIIGGKGWGDVYGLGVSIAQSALAAYSGGSGQALITFFGSAAASGVDDALSRGATSEQAVAYGTMSGLAEALAEQIGVDNLLKVGASSTMRELVWNIIKQGAAEGLEEGATTLMNNFADQLVLQDKSNFHILVEHYMSKGMSEGDAKKKAWLNMANDMAYDMLGGFVSGAAHAGPQTAYQTIATNRDTKAIYGASQNELVSEAIEIDPGNAFAQKMQGRLDSGKNLSGGQLNKLVQQNEATLKSQDMASIQSAVAQRLTELGETGDVQALAAALTKQAAGEKLGVAERRMISDSKYGNRVSNELSTQNINSGGYSSEWAEKIDTNRINVEEYSRLVEAAQLPQETVETSGSQVVTELQNETQQGQVEPEMATVRGSRTVADTTDPANDQQMTGKLTGKEAMESEDGVTRQKSTGKEIIPQKIVSIKGGKVMIQTDNGTIAADDIQFGTKETDLLWRSAADFHGINTAGANGIIRAYKSDQPVATYLNGAAQEFRNGYHNLSSGGEYADKLTSFQREIIYSLGQKAAGENIAMEQSKKTKAKKSEASVSKTEKVGKVHFDRNGRTFDQKRETALKTMEQLSKALGVEFYVFESYVNKAGQRVYRDANGNAVHAPNGWYDPSDGSIHIDLNAGADGKGTMLFTIAHELTHFIREWSPAKFKVLANFLIKLYGENDVSVKILVEEQIKKAKKNGRTIDYDTAFEEVVADSMEAIMADGNVVQFMAELKQQDKALWQKICDWFKDLVNDLKSLVAAYKGVKPDSNEGKLVADMKEMIVVLESLYADAMVEAGENYQAAKAQKNTTLEGDVKMQTRAVNGDQVVWIEENILKGNKGQPVHQFIANYIAEHIDDVYTIIESGQKVYIGEDLPGEYTQSKYTKAILRYNPSISKVKNKASANLGEMIEIATNRRWEKTRHISNKDAKYGIYRYDTRFGFPVKNNRGEIVGANIYGAEILIRNASDGKKYLYDIVNIKKDIASSDWLTQRVTSAAGKSAGQKGDVSRSSVTQNVDGVKKKLSDRDSYGNELSQEQQEYFKDSKVRDKDGNLLVMYHGTKNGDFTVFDRKKAGKRTGFAIYGKGNYFTVFENGASNYGSRVIPAYLKIANPIITSAKTGAFATDVAEALGIKATEIFSQTVSERIKDAGFDGVIVYGIGEDEGNIVICVTYDSSQIKEVSNKNPTSDPDIRYSERDPELEKVTRVLEKENAQLKHDVSYLKELLKLQNQVTGGTKFTKTSVEAAARQLMKYSDAKGDTKELAGLLNAMYEYIAGSKELTWDGVVETAQPAVAWLQNHVRTRTERSAYAKDVLKEIRNSRIYLDETQKKEVAYQYGSYNEFRKKTMGSVILTDNANISLDSQWHAWAEQYPNLFDPDMSSTDMPSALLEVFDSLRNMTETNGYGYERELFGQELLSQVYNSYWNVSTLYTVKDKAQKEINKLKFDHAGRMAKLKQYHKEQAAKLKQEHREDLQRVRQEMRDREEAKLKKLQDQYHESRKKMSENRQKAEMRRKIRKTVMDLNKILNKGDKKRNVKEDMKDLVTQALRSADILFTDNYSNEDMVRYGVGTDMTEQETKYMTEAKDILAEIEATTTAQERQEAETRLQGKLDYRMGKLKDVFVREKARLNKATVAEVLGSLADAYMSLENSDQDYVKGAFDENVYQYLTALKGDAGGTTVKDMSLFQLEELHRAYTMVLTTVRNANKMFAANLKQTREQLGSQTINEVKQAGGERKFRSKAEKAANAFAWNNQKPVYAFEWIGSETLKTLFDNTRAGEDRWAQDMTEAREFYLEQVRKFKYDSWDFKKQYKFTSSSGTDFALNLEQIMSLYAYSKRKQAHDHLLKGGFVFDEATEVIVEKTRGIKQTMLLEDSTAYNVSMEILAEIVSKLNAEQKAFVDQMQDFLSSTMGEKGNEVSMQLYGVKLFNEKFYFPLRSAGQYMERAKEADLKKQQGQISIVNSGFAKSTTPKSSNPVVLSGFMDVWADHVNEMSMYHSFVLPMEDFRRVYNYSSPSMESQAPVSVNSTIRNAYGKAATDYIDQLYRDLNGGAVADPRENGIKSLVGKFKKAAVFTSLSVVVQQPSAIGRAFAIIDPKYFIGSKVDHKRHKALWAELKQYAPVAAIKEMGYFDTGMGKSAQDFITGKEYHGIKEKAAALFTDGDYRDEVLSKAPALADELTWCAIWDAAKRETKAKNPKMDVKSEEFLRLAGKRFTEVITKTQVYDSVLSRSANMRSKGVFMSMWTAFMAEPTTTINMVENALRKAKNGDKKYAARAMGAVMTSIVLNSLLSSLVYAMRDDDEDETFLEKYMQSFATEIMDGINPITYYPFLKDVWSALQGFDIERSDMSLITSLTEKITKLVQIYSKDSESRDENVLADAWWGVVDYATALVGIPVKNVRRDINGAINTYKTISKDLTDRDASWGSLIDQTWDEVKNALPVVGWFPDKTAADKLYEATISGDTAYQKRLASSYKTENSLNSAIRKGLRDNDSRIWEAAMAWNNNNLEGYLRIAKEIVTEGHFSQGNVSMAIQAEAEAMLPAESNSADSKAKGYFTMEKFAVAISQNNHSMAATIKADIIETAQKNGKSEVDAEESFASSAKSNMKEMLMDGKLSEDKAVNALITYCDEDQKNAQNIVAKWKFEADYGFSYDDRADAYKSGEISAYELKTVLIDIGGKTADEANYQIKVYDWENQGYEGVTTAEVKKYYEKVRSSGVSVSVYYKYCQGRKGYSKKDDIMAVIHSLPITVAQKDALYYAEGWEQSKISEAPWH